ncbi:SMI1/KNR4 family protein [Corynebacterium dentalis]|uniref:SMI1/KNR4 family protein n=1 Tax=Corynebacterium dentalis TaxID=2014528 RepID=UPI00289ABC68|nr:SMI1/KNR4 family protein [Corynebacterium dentalis]
MKLSQIEFTHQGKPCGSFRIRSIEEKIGRKLPEDYKKFIKTTGGGTLSLKNTTLAGISLSDGDELEINVEQIFGNGHSEDDDNDLADYASFLAEEWEIPTKVLLIGNPGAGMHESYALNYDLEGFPPHSVLYLDNDEPGQFTLVAESFETFLQKLKPTPDYDPDTAGQGQLSEKMQQDITGAREGTLSPQLKESIAATHIADYEEIVRRAAYNLALTEGGFGVWGSNPAWLHPRDVVYWAAQQVQSSSSLESFNWPFWEDTPWDGNEYQFPTLIRSSFLLEGDFAGVACNEAMLRIWWKRRMEAGVLTETSDGFKLKDDYIATILETLR